MSQVNTIQEAIHDPQVRIRSKTFTNRFADHNDHTDRPVAGMLMALQLHHRKMLVNATNHQNDREYTVLGNPVKISGYRDSNWRPPVPALDEHGDAIRGRSKL